jgi:hypothetical protein
MVEYVFDWNTTLSGAFVCSAAAALAPATKNSIERPSKTVIEELANLGFRLSETTVATNKMTSMLNHFAQASVIGI